MPPRNSTCPDTRVARGARRRPPAGSSRTPLVAALLLGALLVAAAVAAFKDFVDSLDHPPPPLPARVDVIVALSGGSGRFDEAIRLLQEGRAPLLFLVGFQARAVAARLAAEPAAAALAREGRIIVEPRSGSTLEDAERTRTLVADRGARSVLLITSVYHVRRAGLTFRALLPQSVDLHTWPVRSGTFRSGPWYQDESRRRVVLTEFLKYLLYRIRLSFHGVSERTGRSGEGGAAS